MTKIKLLTPSRIIISAICIVGLITTFLRFYKGLGAVTNLSDKFPWGLWVGFDVLCGVALAAGGFVMTAGVYLFNLKRYKPLLRPTILTAFLGYILVSTGLIYDLGKPYNIWHPLIMWNTRSVMFEVAWCVMLYSTVLMLEFSPMIFERLNLEWAQRIIHAIEIPVVITGVVLSTLHQSSLGTVFLIVPGKLHPLWYTSILPILFFISAVAVGISMIIFESYMSSKFFGRSLKFDLLVDISKFLIVALMLYFGLRFQDLLIRGNFKYIFAGTYESVFFIIETLLLAIPMISLMFKRVISSKLGLLISACSVIAGVVVNRLDVAIVGMLRSSGVFYFPSAGEIIISIFLVTIGVTVFILADKHLPVFPQEVEKEEKKMKKVAASAIIILICLAIMPTRVHAGEKDTMGVQQSENVRIQKLSMEDRKNVEPPNIITYKTKYHKSTDVHFDHKTHAESFGLKCIECHHVEKCAHCHGNDTSLMMVEESKIALHETCMGCHRMIESGPRKCEDCHKPTK